MSSNFSSALYPTTELEAINIMLSGIGESPINSFEEVTADVSTARMVLNEISREIQTEGWHWNTEDNFPLTPTKDGFIILPPTVIRTVFSEHNQQDLTIRGRRLYDKSNHSYTFDPQTSLKLQVVVLLPFEDLPESARRYTVLKAARVFQQRVVGSGTLHDFQSRDESTARALMLAEERKQDKPNLISGSAPANTWNISHINLHRRGMYGKSR